MASYTVKKGLRLNLAGAPAAKVSDVLDASTVVVYPSDFGIAKPRLLVREGDTVKRGTALIFDKNNEQLRGCAPAAGVVQSIVLGARRALQEIRIEVARQDAAESFPKFRAADIAGLARPQLLDLLQNTGYLGLLRQRPFSKVPNPSVAPKSIFVNGMNTAPHQADINVVIHGRELAFQAGLDALKRLTDGAVHLCLDGRLQNATALTGARNVTVSTFTGPHPAGNASVHISRLDPIKPGDTVWAVRAADVISIGQLLLDGELPAARIVAVAGTGAQEGARQYYRVKPGTPLQYLLGSRLVSGEQRIIRGDVLAGSKTDLQSAVRLADSIYNVIPEDRERHLLGWMAPGFNSLSVSKSFVSGWIGSARAWALGTNQHGELRPMVLTGLYDKYLPLNIMVDFLIRAILANDTEEAIKLGILETDPEDFAVCAFACPSKMDLVAIVRQGLQDIEKEGI